MIILLIILGSIFLIDPGPPTPQEPEPPTPEERNRAYWEHLIWEDRLD